MTRILARPHRTTTDHRIDADPWQVTIGDRVIPDPVELSGWDYATDLRVTRSLRVDRSGVLADCGLPDSATTAVVLCWHARATTTRGNSTPIAITDDTTTTITIAADLPGPELGGTLELTTRIVLVNELAPDDPLTAHRPGSILWESRRHRLALEGSLSRFPVTLIDFADHPSLANNALWGLGWNPGDLDRPALGALCLYINRAHPAHEGLVGDTPRQDLVDALRVDLTRTLVDGVLDDAAFDGPDPHTTDTLGAVVAHLFNLVFPDTDTDTLRAMRRRRRSMYESQFQAVIGIGEA